MPLLLEAVKTWILEERKRRRVHEINLENRHRNLQRIYCLAFEEATMAAHYAASFRRPTEPNNNVISMDECV